MMADAKHTPGPWMAAAKPSSVVGWPVIAPRAETGMNVCNVHLQDNAQANARLIAAAPDLLAALKLAEAYLNVSLGSPSWTGENPYPVIRAALSRAEGASE